MDENWCNGHLKLNGRSIDERVILTFKSNGGKGESILSGVSIFQNFVPAE